MKEGAAALWREVVLDQARVVVGARHRAGRRAHVLGVRLARLQQVRVQRRDDDRAHERRLVHRRHAAGGAALRLRRRRREAGVGERARELLAARIHLLHRCV